MIVLTRADDRLIHGLVAVAWTSHLAPETILVANDAAAADSFKKNSLKLAKARRCEALRQVRGERRRRAQQPGQRQQENLPGHADRGGRPSRL